jgi:glycosyltransferase involved in cell wall biosynthesis
MGARIRTHSLLTQLARHFELVGLCFYRAGSVAEIPRQRIDELKPLGRFEAFPVPETRRRSRMVGDHLRSLLSSRPYTVYLYDSAEYTDRLGTLLAEGDWDLVLVDSLDLSGSLALLDRSRTICAHHDVESQQLERRAGIETTAWRRRYVERQARLMAAEERRWCPEVALNLTVSDADRTRLQAAAGGRYLVVPNGVDLETMGEPTNQGSGAVFVGPGSWLPNRDAMQFFASEILPAIREAAAGLQVTWVGRVDGADRDWFEQQGVRMTGYVPDVRPWVRDAACAIVPLRAGTGTRIKILEAWGLGKAVVSTAIGCEGLAAVDGENILIRDDPRAFAHAVVELERDAELRRRLGESARRTVEGKYDWRRIGETLAGEMTRMIEERIPR